MSTVASLTCRCLVVLLLVFAASSWTEANPMVTSTVAPPCGQVGEVRDSQGVCRCGPDTGRKYVGVGSNSSYICEVCKEDLVPVEVLGRSSLGDTACCHAKSVAVRELSNLLAECHAHQAPAPVLVLSLPVFQPAPAQYDGISPQEIIIIIVVTGLILAIIAFLVRDIRRNSEGI